MPFSSTSATVPLSALSDQQFPAFIETGTLHNDGLVLFPTVHCALPINPAA
ncbi:MAG: hypothetical protein WCI00_00435 [bacterium]